MYLCSTSLLLCIHKILDFIFIHKRCRHQRHPNGKRGKNTKKLKDKFLIPFCIAVRVNLLFVCVSFMMTTMFNLLWLYISWVWEICRRIGMVQLALWSSICSKSLNFRLIASKKSFQFCYYHDYYYYYYSGHTWFSMQVEHFIEALAHGCLHEKNESRLCCVAFK